MRIDRRVRNFDNKGNQTKKSSRGLVPSRCTLGIPLSLSLLFKFSMLVFVFVLISSVNQSLESARR